MLYAALFIMHKTFKTALVSGDQDSGLVQLRLGSRKTCIDTAATGNYSETRSIRANCKVESTLETEAVCQEAKRHFPD